MHERSDQNVSSDLTNIKRRLSFVLRFSVTRLTTTSAINLRIVCPTWRIIPSNGVNMAWECSGLTFILRKIQNGEMKFTTGRSVTMLYIPTAMRRIAMKSIIVCKIQRWTLSRYIAYSQRLTPYRLNMHASLYVYNSRRTSLVFWWLA